MYEQSPLPSASIDKANEEASLGSMYAATAEEDAAAAAASRLEHEAAAEDWEDEHGEDEQEQELDMGASTSNKHHAQRQQPRPPPPPPFLRSAHPAFFPMPPPRASPPPPESPSALEPIADINARRTAQLLRDAELDKEVDRARAAPLRIQGPSSQPFPPGSWRVSWLILACCTVLPPERQPTRACTDDSPASFSSPYGGRKRKSDYSEATGTTVEDRFAAVREGCAAIYASSTTCLLTHIPPINKQTNRRPAGCCRRPRSCPLPTRGSSRTGARRTACPRHWTTGRRSGAKRRTAHRSPSSPSSSSHNARGGGTGARHPSSSTTTSPPSF